MILIFKKLSGFYFSFPMRSKRFIWLILLAIPIFISTMIVFIYMFFLSKISVFDALVVNERQSLSDLKQFQGIAAESAQYETHQRLLVTALDNVKAHFADILHFNKVIDGIAKERDVMINHYIKLPNERVSDVLIRSSVKLTGCSGYQDFARFLNELAMHKRTILLKSVVITQKKNGEISTRNTAISQSCINQDLFSFVMTLSAYQYVGADKAPISAIP